MQHRYSLMEFESTKSFLLSQVCPAIVVGVVVFVELKSIAVLPLRSFVDIFTTVFH